MSNFINQIKSIFFDKAQVLPPGLYNYQTPKDSEYQYRLHLRIEPDGEGILIINASTVLHLNQTATELAYYLVNQVPKQEATELIVKRYQINFTEATKDYEDFMESLETIINTPDLDPVTYLGFDRLTPYEDFPVAPYRLDCALTYHLTSPDSEGYSPNERVTKDLSFEEWKSILAKAWEVGIPHVIFTGGEPTLRPNLVDLIQTAENFGMVTGLSTDGLKLADDVYLDQILNSGLDHLLITLNPNQPESWDSVMKVIPQDIHTTVHLTIDERGLVEYLDIFSKLQQFEVENISLSYSDQQFENKTLELRNKAAEYGFNLDWDLPVPYSQFNPVSSEINDDDNNPNGAAKAWLYIEPDGDVLPGQGITKKLGNFLQDSWESIWQNAKEFNKIK